MGKTTHPKMAKTGGSAHKSAKKRARPDTSAVGLVGGGNAAAARRGGSVMVKRSVDQYIADLRFHNAQQPLCLCPVAEGSGFYNRIGRTIILKTMHIKGQVIFDPTPTGIDNLSTQWRLALIYDRESNGAQISITDVFRSFDSLGAATTTTYSGLNLDERKRFHIFRDERIYFNSSTTQTLPTQSAAIAANQLQGQVCNIDWFVKLNDLSQDYKAVQGTLGSISSGALYLVAYSNHVAGNSRGLFQGEARLRFCMPGER